MNSTQDLYSEPIFWFLITLIIILPIFLFTIVKDYLTFNDIDIDIKAKNYEKKRINTHVTHASNNYIQDLKRNYISHLNKNQPFKINDYVVPKRNHTFYSPKIDFKTYRIKTIYIESELYDKKVKDNEEKLKTLIAKKEFDKCLGDIKDRIYWAADLSDSNGNIIYSVDCSTIIPENSKYARLQEQIYRKRKMIKVIRSNVYKDMVKLKNLD